MAETTWEKNPEAALKLKTQFASKRRYGYLVAGVGLMAIVAFLLVNGMATGSYYITVDELLTSPDKIDKNVRVAGAVDGSSIVFDPSTQILTFTVVAIPNDNDTIREAGGLGMVLHQALQPESDAMRMEVLWHNAEMPDLLQHEAQAIMTGKLGDDGIFYADQVLLKCPTRYSDEVPQQAASQ